MSALAATELLSSLVASGVHLGVTGDELEIEGPKEILTRRVLDELRNHKQELLQLLAEGEGGVSIPSETPATVQHPPSDPQLADSLVGEITESRPCLTVSDVCAMPLSEFAQAALVVEVRSSVLDEVVIFASDNALVDPGEQRTVYRAAELRALLGIRQEDLRQLHQVKSTFRGTITGN